MTKEEKQKLIDWVETAAKFGYQNIDEVSNKSPVAVICSMCGLPKLLTTLVSMRARGGRPFTPICKSCQTKRVWQETDGFREHQAAIQSERMKEVWIDDDYRDNLSTKIGVATKARWQDNEFRAKVVDGLKRKHAEDSEFHNKSVAALLEANAARTDVEKAAAIAASTVATRTQEFRDAASQRSLELWKDDDFRQRTVAGNRKSWESPERRAAAARALARQPRISGLQTSLYTALDGIGITYHKEGLETAIGYFAFDCLVPKQGTMTKHLLIECQGEYWHSKPASIHNDRAKFTYIDRYFPDHEIMYLWEHEFSAIGRVAARLASKLGIASANIQYDFKDLTVVKVDKTAAREFFDAYHYIGGNRGGDCFGAMLNGELIACVLYSKPLRQNTSAAFGVPQIVELSRLCIKPSYTKHNLISWLLARTIPANQTVIAYADTTAGHHGTAYLASGFSLHHETPVDYWYVDVDGFVMHKRTLYGRAVKLRITEADYAVRFGYQKRWGGKKLCFMRRT